MTTDTMRVRSVRRNQTEHSARIDAGALIDLANKAVAEQLGLDLSALSGEGLLELGSFTSTYQEGSLSTSKPCVEVRIVVRHAADEIDR